MPNTQTNGGGSMRMRLVQSTFMYIAACLRDGDVCAIRRLRIRPDQATRLLKMTAAELLTLAESDIECVTIDVNPDALDDLLIRLQHTKSREELIAHCIKRDAPRAMMQAFFGFSRHRYSQCRAAFSVPTSRGRAAKPAESVEANIFKEWSRAGGHWTASQLLEVAETLNISLRTVWDALGPLRRLRAKSQSNRRRNGQCLPSAGR